MSFYAPENTNHGTHTWSADSHAAAVCCESLHEPKIRISPRRGRVRRREEEVVRESGRGGCYECSYTDARVRVLAITFVSPTRDYASQFRRCGDSATITEYKETPRSRLRRSRTLQCDKRVVALGASIWKRSRRDSSRLLTGCAVLSPPPPPPSPPPLSSSSSSSARESSHFRRLLLAVHPHLAALVGRVAGTRKKKQPADGFC